MLAETPVTQRSPCYSAVSTSLMNPLPDCSNYSPFCHTQSSFSPDNTSLVSWARPFTEQLLETSLLQSFTADSSQELMSSEEYRSALRKMNNKQMQVVMLLLLFFKLSSQLPFVSFSFLSISVLSMLLFSILSLLPFLISPSLSTIPSFSSDQFSVLLR